MTNKILHLLFVLLLFSSCNSSGEAVHVNALNGKWNKKNAQIFNFNIEDAQHPKNIIFVVRNNNDYPYSNLRLIVSLEDSKSKKKITDTLNYTMAKPNGEWIGKGFGDTKEILFQYKLDYTFPQNGKYTLKAIQAMRNDTLPGIEDFGIKIESVKPQERDGK